MAAVARFGVSLSGAALFITLYDGNVCPWDRDHSFIWTFALAFASATFLVVEAHPPFIPYIFYLTAALFALIHAICVTFPPPAPTMKVDYAGKNTIGRARNLNKKDKTDSGVQPSNNSKRTGR